GARTACRVAARYPAERSVPRTGGRGCQGARRTKIIRYDSMLSAGSSPGPSARMEPISLLVSGEPVALYPNRMAEIDEIAGDPLLVRRKRLRYRSWHRGTRE